MPSHPVQSSHPLLPIDQALQLVLAHTRPLPLQTVALERALGAWVAHDLSADLDQPPFDRSAMDGFALHGSDVGEDPVRLLSIGSALAGSPWPGHLEPGTCIRIMTGAVVPPGAAAVVPVEQATVQATVQEGAASWVSLERPRRAGQHIARKGSEVAKGAVVLRQGQEWTPGRIGVAASFGHAQVQICRRPRVAILPTGDEIVPIHTAPGHGQIRDSNRFSLAALLERAGAEVMHFPTAPDSPEGLLAAVAEAWEASDLLLTSGGVSAGDFDLVAPTLERLGATAHFHKIAIKPGKPLLFASRGDQIALGLPGNPVSSLVCALLFALPAVARLRGALQTEWKLIHVPAALAAPAVGPRTEIVPARWTQHQGATAVSWIGTRGSADLASFSQSDCLVLRPAGQASVNIGDLVSVLWAPGL